MKLVEIKDQNKWNDFLGAQEHAEFLQSWEWGEFQEKVEGKIFRFGVEENGELIAAATLVKKSLPWGRVRRSLGVGGMNYFYCPRGPIINYKLQIINYKSLDFLIDEINKIAQKEKVIFLRIEPKEKIPNSIFHIQNSIDIQPSQTIILDLNKTEQELLAAMHQKTRYNIRLAEKKGVIIKESPLERGAESAVSALGVGEMVRVKSDCFDTFWNLMEKTSGRDGFTPHGKDYYEKLLQTAPERFKLFVAKYNDKIIAAGIFSFFGDTVTYLFGASDNDHREVMAPYLLQWELIKKAKSAGCRFYDFFGIDEKKWPGVTRFKRGFGGQEINYPGTFDVIFKPFNYFIYLVIRGVRRLF